MKTFQNFRASYYQSFPETDETVVAIASVLRDCTFDFPNHSDKGVAGGDCGNLL
jgi:hypothetical protein